MNEQMSANYRGTPTDAGTQPLNPAQEHETLRWVREYLRRGWRVIPLHRQRGEGKQPKAQRGWNEPEYYERVAQSPEQYFSPRDNVGLLVGAVSGVVDVDLDAPEARALASWFLPPTPCKFGRRSAPNSHWLYHPNQPMRQKTFAAPAGTNAKEGTLVELRADSRAGKPHNTMLPPSWHSGANEQVEWSDPTALPAEVEACVLEQAVRHLAAASLLCRHWARGKRHNLTLGAAGMLLKAGWAQSEVEHFIRAIATSAGDEELDSRLLDVRSTANTLAQGKEVAGVSLLREHLDETAVRRLTEWLGIQTTLNPQEQARPLTVEIAPAEGVVRACLLALEQLWRNQYRWCIEWQAWLRWTARVWERVDEDTTLREAHETLIHHFTSTMHQVRDRKSLEVLARYIAELARSNRAVNQSLRLLRGSEGFRTHASELDADAYQLNTPLGVVDLRTLRLHPHTPDLLCTKITRGSPHPNTRAERFERFLREVFANDAELIAFVQRACGLALIGENRHQLLYIWHGAGANGKSTLLQAILYAVGDYGRVIPRDALIGSERRASGERRIALAALEGVRLGVLEEFEDGAELSPVALKHLVSNLTMQVRGLYEQYRDISIRTTPIVATNLKPHLREHTHGVWRRLRLVPFAVTIPPDQRDPSLPRQLQAEADGVLRWMLDGLQDYWARGGRLDEPQQVWAATDEYRREIDPLATFLEERCEMGTHYCAFASELYEAYRAWWQQVGEESALMSQTRFGRELRARGFLSTRERNTKRKLWMGLRLREPTETVGNGLGVFQSGGYALKTPFTESAPTVSNCFLQGVESADSTAQPCDYDAEFTQWLQARLHHEGLWGITGEEARDLQAIWCAGCERGYPEIRLEYEAYGHRHTQLVPAGASGWLEWLQQHYGSIWQDCLHRTLFPCQPFQFRGSKSDGET